MKKERLLKSLLVVLAMSLFSVVALAQATTVGTYKKVTAAPANGDWSGQYLIVGISGSNYYIFKPSYKAITERIPTAQMADIVISEDKITVPQSTLDALIAYDSYYNGYDTKGEFHVIIDGEGGDKNANRFLYRG